MIIHLVWLELVANHLFSLVRVSRFIISEDRAGNTRSRYPHWRVVLWHLKFVAARGCPWSRRKSYSSPTVLKSCRMTMTSRMLVPFKSSFTSLGLKSSFLAWFQGICSWTRIKKTHIYIIFALRSMTCSWFNACAAKSLGYMLDLLHELLTETHLRTIGMKQEYHIWIIV